MLHLSLQDEGADEGDTSNTHLHKRKATVTKKGTNNLL